MRYVDLTPGEEVAVARINANMTQKQLGSLVGLSVSTVTRIETNRRPIMPEVIVSISRVLKCGYLLRSYCARCPVAAARSQIGEGIAHGKTRELKSD